MIFNYKKLSKSFAILLVALFSLPTFAQSVNCSGVANWVSQSYSGGQKVVLDGKLYQANWWTTSNPSTDNGPSGSGKSWTLLGTCTSTVTPQVQITSPTDGQAIYLKASENPTVPVTVSLNTTVDSVQYIVVNTVCNGPGCAQVVRYNVKTAPYTLNLAPTFNATYTEITAVAFRNGIGYTGNTVKPVIKALPELVITNLPATGAKVFVDESAPYSVNVNTDVNDEFIRIDSVEFILVQIAGYGNGTSYHEVRKVVKQAPYNVSFDQTEAYLGQHWTRVVAIPYGDGGKTAGSKTTEFDLLANPTVQITSPNEGQYHYLKASTNPTVNVTVATNAATSKIDSVYYIVVDILCNGPGCANVRRFTQKQAPYTLNLAPIFGSTYTEIYAIAFSNGRASDASYHITNHFVALPEAKFLNLTEGGNYTTNANNPEIFVDIDVNDEFVRIDSVQYVLIQHEGSGPYPTVRELYKTVKTAPFDITFNSSEVYLNQNWTRVVAIPFGDGGKTAGAASVIFNVVAQTNTCSVPAWVSGTEYCGGAKVSRNGIIYTADWCTSLEPGTGQWIGWTATGTCGSSRVATVSSNVSVYPNPVVDVLTINANGTYSVVNVLGNVVAQGSVNGTTQIDATTWAQGSYIVTIVGETTESIVVIK